MERVFRVVIDTTKQVVWGRECLICVARVRARSCYTNVTYPLFRDPPIKVPDNCENFCPATGVLRARSGKKSPKWVPKASQLRGPKESQTESKKHSVWDFLEPRGRTHFGLFLPLWVRRAQMTPATAGSENLNPIMLLECSNSTRACQI